MLQIANQNDAVRHALIALAALDESNQADRDLVLNEVAGNFALKQYNSAIRRHLNQLNSSGDRPTIEALVPCLVFICIEV